MKNKISKAAAALALAAAAVFAAPAVASAYTPDVVGGNTATIAPGGTGTFTFNNFIPNESVIFTLTGENAAGGTLALITAAANDTLSTEKEANEDGEASVAVTLPENASGDYTLTAVGEESGPAATSVTISVAATGGEDDGGVLTPTGFDGDQLLGIWVGGGVLVLAGASIAVATSVRRSRQAA